jgi:hypothetical protein
MAKGGRETKKPKQGKPRPTLPRPRRKARLPQFLNRRSSSTFGVFRTNIKKRST